MDENRVQAYVRLIKDLLKCDSGEEAQILQANSELVDAGLVAVMQQVAEQMAAEENENIAGWLRNMASEIAQMLGIRISATPQDYLQFLMEVLQATQDSQGDKKVVYPLLQANLDKLDDGLTQILQAWATQTLSEAEPQQAQSIAAVLVQFGNLIQQFPRGNKASNMETAITSYEKALDVYTRDGFPVEWATTQNNLATAYHNRIRGEKAENVETAIAFCENALIVNTRDGFPEGWADTHNNLANAYRKRIRGEKAENAERAIASYENALEVYTRDGFPEGWAMTQNNLANAYIERIRGEKAKNVKMAIALYKKALEVLTREAFPEDWAMTHNNLANAYSDRIRGEKAENLEMAIASYENALEVYTGEAFPFEWATTQNNLANAYRNRIRGEKAENLETAIASYEKAVEVLTRDAFPYEWGRTHNNLAAAYSNRIRGEEAENLEMAITSYKKALEVRTRDAFPVEWARTHNNLAAAYSNRIRGEKAENLEEAIASYEKAVEVLTRDAFPYEWATTHNNLAAAYSNRIRGEKAENLEKAIASYKKALEVDTCDAFPENYTQTLFNLGVAYQDSEKWQDAYNTFSDAINATESLREEILSGDESKQKLAEEHNRIYIGIVETCLQLNQPIEALEYAERSKTRNLVEQILLRDSQNIFPTDVANKLAQLRDDIASAQYQIQKGQVENYQELAQRLQDLRQQRNQLQDQYLPVGYGFQFDTFQQILDSETAVIEWYLVDETFLAFIILPPSSDSRGVEGIVPPSTSRRGAGGEVIVWQSTIDDFEQLGNWANTYLQNYYSERDTWRDKLTDELQKLADILHLDELLAHLPASCNRLILIPHRFLHLFPLHALPVKPETASLFLEPDPKGRKPCTPTEEYAETEPSYLLDIFPKGVSYAPSCQLLQQVKTRQRSDFDKLFAVQTPTPDLYEKYEKDLGAVGAIKKQFSHSNILRKGKATKAALLPTNTNTQTLTPLEDLKSAHCLFFFCHGYFNPNSPLDSGLVLADDNLTLAEIIAYFRLENCRLVTLSACETGIPDFNNISDEYISLPYGFLLAGSTNVVSSLWEVDATATALLMIKFYEELQQQDNIALALRTAQFWLRNTTVEGFQTWVSQSNLIRVWRVKLEGYFEKWKQEMGATTKLFNSPDYWSAFCIVGKGE
ncbi:CHAT domain-containing protein [Limnoraphis robusta Tam1]|uniref:CHAT domain-containing tetratricopeptide repeat protein n=1 Tax=Limnoraphis robusta TaxID=1118279 RepID=UPI002B21CFDD|nr:CHAT domain-containing protein [Limnoraphis robusta]MEA5498447.1 CHAT domain-containing protein [Limnoraphis robusta BA-68 BA1]MEA5542388.1 CHAT domain-containing protein [Limnoraphis robusta Tam1]